MSVKKNWTISQELLTDLEQKTRLVFLQLEDDFRPDTPDVIKKLFKQCVDFNKALRLKFINVSKYFI